MTNRNTTAGRKTADSVLAVLRAKHNGQDTTEPRQKLIDQIQKEVRQ